MDKKSDSWRGEGFGRNKHSRVRTKKKVVCPKAANRPWEGVDQLGRNRNRRNGHDKH